MGLRKKIVPPAHRKTCRHCGTPVPRGIVGEYCCRGCEYVAGLIERSGFGTFYDLRGGAIPPVSPSTLRSADFGWLDELLQPDKNNPQQGRLLLDLKGVSCIGCVWLIEKVFEQEEMRADLAVSPQRGQMEISWHSDEARQAIPSFLAKIRQFGYVVAPPGEVGDITERLGPRIGLCAALAMNTMLFTLPTYLGMEDDFPFARLFTLLTVVFASLSFLAGGAWFIARAWRGLKRKVLSIDLPIALGVSAAYGGSLVGYFLALEDFLYFDFVAVFIFLMLVGRWLHERALERNRNRVRATDLSRVRYETLKGERLTATAIRQGMRFLVPPGGVVPVASEASALVSLSLESINGEADPRVFATGARLPSGAVMLGNQPVEVCAREDWADSLLYELLRARPDAERNRLMERVLEVYISAVVLIALGGWIWWGAARGDWITAAQVFLSILVVSCPCAMGVAYPMINDLAAVLLRRRGVFVREASVWSRLASVDTVVFDKTGTLTLETLDFVNEEALADLTAAECDALRVLVEGSFHPLARTLRETLVARGVGLPEQLFAVEEIPGQGLRAATGPDYYLGKGGELDQEGTRAVFRRGDEILAHFIFRDRLRSGAREEMKWLNQSGYRVAILSGDRPGVVDKLAAELGMAREQALGGLSPQEKRDWIRQHAPGRAMMVGDGLNDSLAFHEALCRATPLLDKGILEERSDFYFSGTGLGGLRWLIQVFRRRRSALRTIFSFAVSYNLAAISLCLAGWMNPLVAAIIMPLSSVFTLSMAGWFLRDSQS